MKKCRMIVLLVLILLPQALACLTFSAMDHLSFATNRSQ